MFGDGERENERERERRGGGLKVFLLHPPFSFLYPEAEPFGCFINTIFMFVFTGQLQNNCPQIPEKYLFRIQSGNELLFKYDDTELGEVANHPICLNNTFGMNYETNTYLKNSSSNQLNKSRLRVVQQQEFG